MPTARASDGLSNCTGSAKQLHAAFVRPNRTADHLDHRALARAIVTDQTDHLTRRHTKANIVGRRHRAITFGKVGTAKDRIAPFCHALWSVLHRSTAGSSLGGCRLQERLATVDLGLNGHRRAAPCRGILIGTQRQQQHATACNVLKPIL